jgi:predicted alpha/beta hydrolase
MRVPMFVTWHLAMPVVARAIGFVPARRFGTPERLPAGVARDWSSRAPARAVVEP